MASSARILGQDTTVLITRDGNLEDTLTNVVSFSVEDQFELKSQGYLGRKTDDKDYFFKGSKFDLELHLHRQEWFKFRNAMLAKAKRETPDLVFSITTVLNFPNGETPTVTFNDVAFGAVPLNAGGRGDYISVKLTGECSEASQVTS